MTEDEDRERVERLFREPARYCYKVDVGNASTEDAEAFLKKVKKQMKGKNLKNPMDTGDDTIL